MLKQYIKDYLNIETKNMSESEMEKMMAKAKKMIEDEVEQKKKMDKVLGNTGSEEFQNR